ncbi:MAG TPA: protoporphyrinogen oxidase [Candidatus Hydrogenedentes bacterium]|nr:protoporphyrinogen oxidase [Candidatus Hydrogenedentota bacterium]
MTSPRAEHALQVAVVGGGITGLCAGWHAARKWGADAVRVLEAGEGPGGTTRSDREGGYILDWGPNGFLDREPATLEWLEALGAAALLRRADEASARRYILRHGKLHRVAGPPAFFLSPLLSPMGRLRVCCEPLVPAKRDHTGESIHDFAQRRIGREAAETLVGPMVSGVFGGDARQLSLEHCFPRMAEMERVHGGLFRALLAKRKTNPKASPVGPSGTLTTLENGIGQLPEIAAEALGGAFAPRSPVRKIAPSGGEYQVSCENGDVWRARNVVVACPAYAAAPMLAETAPGAADALNAIPYAGMAVVCAGYKRDRVAHPLDGFGFLVPRDGSLRMLGCLWTSSIFPHQAPADGVLLRTMLGGATDPNVLSLTDTELVELVAGELNPLLGITGQPDLLRVFRHPRGIPQYTLGHGSRLEALERCEAEHPGLVFAGNAYRGVGLNDCVLSARRAVDRLRA